MGKYRSAYICSKARHACTTVQALGKPKHFIFWKKSGLHLDYKHGMKIFLMSVAISYFPITNGFYHSCPFGMLLTGEFCNTKEIRHNTTVFMDKFKWISLNYVQLLLPKKIVLGKRRKKNIVIMLSKTKALINTYGVFGRIFKKLQVASRFLMMGPITISFLRL